MQLKRTKGYFLPWKCECLELLLGPRVCKVGLEAAGSWLYGQPNQKSLIFKGQREMGRGKGTECVCLLQVHNLHVFIYPEALRT